MAEGNGHSGSKWERLLETKPIPLIDHLVEEAAKLLAADLATWPPPIQDLDPLTGAHFAPLLEPGTPRPDDRVYEEAFRLTHWELEHDLEAYDDYMRNRRWMERGLPAESKGALLFLSRWLYEQVTALAEATENRVKRKHLALLLERAQSLLGATRTS
ncbi:MAG TPA: hypothetical protein VFA20_02355 [Myxococcaceae bacterium]|nr:hypothetical protein [Myxococcaceae bacterium]